MTPKDFYDHVVVFVWAHWGKPKQGPWTERAAGTVAADFEPFQVGHVREALHNLYSEGYQLAPSPSKLLAATTHIARSSYNTYPGPAECQPGSHVWAWSVLGPVVDCVRCGAEAPDGTHLRLAGGKDNPPSLPLPGMG